MLGQVVTSNDPAFSAFFSVNCVTRGVPPFEVTNRICVGKHSSFQPQPTLPETLGYVVFEEAVGILNGVRFETERGLDNVEGIDNGVFPYLSLIHI